METRRYAWREETPVGVAKLYDLALTCRERPGPKPVELSYSS
jgi:hypothetical protein